MKWYQYPVGVPFGSRDYDVALGGSHDMTFACPPNTEISSIVSGVISDISSPSWGKQICLRMDKPVNNHPTFAYLHCSAIDPHLRVGQRVEVGQIIAWSGGCTNNSQYVGTQNPTGQNFVNTPAMSSQPQIGIALCDGAGYGYRGWSDWTGGKAMDLSLDPTVVLKRFLQPAVNVDFQRAQFNTQWQSIVGGLSPETGIAGVAFEMYVAGHDPGPPLTKELENVDWNGRQHLYQVFPSGMIYWYPDGNHQWHPFSVV